MNIIRTFHPVGQGAFYSERFYERGSKESKYIIVFDCGTAWGGVSKSKKVVTQAFNNKDTIDYLFISHLDFDHISLVDTLLKSVKAVRHIVLPLITVEDLMIVMAYHQLSGKGTARFLRRIINHLRGDYDDDYLDSDYSVVFVGDEVEDNNDTGNGTIWKNGTNQQAGLAPDWVLIPYNIGYRSRKQDLVQQFKKVVTKPEFNSQLQNIGEAPVQNAEDLYGRLQEEGFVGKVISNTALKNAIKTAYEKLPGGTNENSFLLYSGPSEACESYILSDTLPCYYWYWFEGYEPGCLYTGDSTCDLQGWKDVKYTRVWDKIGTIQLPHHGSLESFDVNANSIDKRYIFPVSCGSTNSYGHPSGKVLAYLMTQGCKPVIVTEMAGTVFVERIVG